MDFSAHNETTTEHQVWTVDRVTGQPVYAYRTNLGAHSIARTWAAAWNAKTPADVMDGTTFVAVIATSTTTFQEA